MTVEAHVGLMAETPAGKCGYTWPEDHEVGDDPDHQSCCWRDSLPDTDRCAWHTDPENTDEKNVETLQDARVDPDVREQTSPVGELLDGAILRGFTLDGKVSFRRVNLKQAEFSNASLKDADFQATNLRGIDLSDAHLPSANLRGAALQGADCRNAHL